MKNRRSTTKAYFIKFASGILHCGHFPEQLFIYSNHKQDNIVLSMIPNCL